MDSIAKPMINPNRFYTYAYLREDKTPYYIGKGTGKRIYSTNRKVKPPKDKSKIIYLKKNLTEEEAFKHEIYMIAVLGRKDLGTGILRNLTDGGDGTSGAVISEETRKKIGDARKGKKSPNYGKNHSKEARQRMSESSKGKTASEETKQRMSEAQKGAKNPNYGKIASEETKEKISKANKGKKNPNYGKIASEETRQKMSKAIKGRKWWNDGCGNCKMQVDCPGNDWKLGIKRIA